MTTPTHEALIYHSDDDFAAVVLPFLADGLRRGDYAVAAVTAHNIDLLRQGLGGAAGDVTFIDRDSWYERPASTIAGWTGLLRDAQARGHRSMCAVGEVGFGTADRHDTWIRYESAVNDVFADVPAWIICPYDTRRLPDRVVTGARRTHPVVTAGRRRRSALYEPPEQLLRSLAEPLPPVTQEPLIALALTEATGPRQARQALEAVARALGWDREKINDLLLVVTEVTLNCLRHGRGDRRLDVWIDGDTITCDVTDNGDGPADPLVGYRAPESPRLEGVGLWLANQLCDRLAIEHRDGLTRVRFSLRGTLT